MKTVRLAQIGLGAWGKNIEKTLRALSGCELAYTAAEDWRELLDKKDIDGAGIATPPATHPEIAIAFLQQGVPVFIEKPMTGNLADALAVEAAVRASGAPVMAVHLHLYSPAYRKTKELARDIGNIHFITSRGHNKGPYRSDYSAMWDWAPHDLSMILDIFGEQPTAVSAWGVSPTRPGSILWDFAQIKLEFAGSITGFITSSWLMPTKCKQLTIVGEKQSIVYEDTKPDQKISLYENKEVSYQEYGNEMSLTEELAAFTRVVADKEKPLSGLEEGLAVIRIPSSIVTHLCGTLLSKKLASPARTTLSTSFPSTPFGANICRCAPLKTIWTVTPGDGSAHVSRLSPTL